MWYSDRLRAIFCMTVGSHILGADMCSSLIEVATHLLPFLLSWDGLLTWWMSTELDRWVLPYGLKNSKGPGHIFMKFVIGEFLLKIPECSDFVSHGTCLRTILHLLKYLLEGKNISKQSSKVSGLESREYERRDPSRWPRGTPVSAKVGTNFVDKRRSLGGNS
jgi:hypothetical protein